MPTLKTNTISSGDLSTPSGSLHTAHTLDGQQRQQLALEGLARTEPLTKIAERNNVSRKFVYKQMDKAEIALQKEFDPPSHNDEVLYWIPVTKKWLRSVVLALLLYCHSSYRGVIAFFADLLGKSISLGTIHNIVNEAIVEAQKVNAKQDLSKVTEGAHDELFQGSLPVLTGIDLNSFYCYLLSVEDRRDAETWAIHLWDLEKQGLQPERIIADAGKGLRAGQALAWPTVPCDGDHFHILHLMGSLTTTLDNRAYGAIASLDKLEKQMVKAKKKSKGHILSKKLAKARGKEADAIRVASDLDALTSWLRNDILTLNGIDADTRGKLYDFVAESLHELEHFCPHRIQPVYRALVNQRNELLAFAQRLDLKIERIAQQFHVSPELVRQVLNLSHINPDTSVYWKKTAELYQKLGKQFYPLQQAIGHMRENFNRASSLVENFNGRLRNYFFLRRQVGPGYLDLLRFFLNHTPFMRSERKEREGKSPAELLSGQSHSHWLEMIGFTRFQKVEAIS